MSKYKAGLHKDVSAIFNGVSLPKSSDARPPSTTPAPAHQDYIAPKPPAPELPAPKLPAPEPPAQKPPTPEPSAQKPPASEPPVQKPRAPSHMTPTRPKPMQPPSLPKAAPPKRPKPNAATKAARQAPWQRTLEQIKNKLLAQKPGGSTTTKQKVMVILAPILFVVLIFVFIRVFSTPSKDIKGPKGPKKSGPAKVAASDKKIDWRVPEPYPTTLRDPMQFGPATADAGQADASGLIVKGIVYSRNNPCAVIGDQIVHQGDKVMGVVIVKINENSVEFGVNGKKWTQKVQR